jgi:lipoic acid synthetase
MGLFQQPPRTESGVNPEQCIRKPAWLKKRIRAGRTRQEVQSLLREASLHTVCEEARCPNLAECFSRRTATVLIMGDRCTRDCRFCAVRAGVPEPLDPEEPVRVAELADRLGLGHVVVTSVTRDDLPDGGARHFAETIRRVRTRVSSVRVEVLIPDFQGSAEALGTVLDAGPDVLNHNIETVPRLYGDVRPEADYGRSLQVLSRTRARKSGIVAKAGLMLGMGEREEEIRSTLEDLLVSGCQLLTLGQYLQPTDRHHPVERFVAPQEFDDWAERARTMGFLGVASGPFVRSSYRAAELLTAARSEVVANSPARRLTAPGRSWGHP